MTSAGVAVHVLADDVAAWTIGALVSAGAFAAFIAGRTTGLPGLHSSHWEIAGVATLVLEAVIVGAFIVPSRSERRPVPSPARRQAISRRAAGAP